MEMCPYCGEDVPAESKTCWKCGTELSGSPSAPPGAGGDEVVQQRRRPKDVPQTECPSCGTPVGIHALRCNDCGQPLRKGAGKSWIPAVYTAFGVILVVTVVWFLLSLFLQEEPEAEREHIPATHAQLLRLYKSDKFQERWDTDHKGKFVEWEVPGTVLEVRDDKSVALGSDDKADRKQPDALLVLKDPTQIEARGLKPGKLVKYSARLVRYEGKTIHLEDGILK